MLFSDFYRLILPGAALIGSGLYFAATAPDLALPFFASQFIEKSWVDGSMGEQFDNYVARAAPWRQSARNSVGLLRMTVFDEIKGMAVTGDDGWLFAKGDLVFDEGHEQRVRGAADQVAQVASYLASYGVELLVVPLPVKADFAREHHSFDLQADRAETAYQEFLTELSDRGVTTVDIRERLLVARTIAPVVLKSDQHWTPYGARAAASAVRDVVEANWPSLLGHEDARLLAGPVTRFQGDLTYAIGDADTAGAAGILAEVVRSERAVDSSGADLVGRAGGSVVLVGTSASADPLWSFASYLASGLSQPIVNLAITGVGPMKPMFTALHSASLLESRPKLVIWEFPVNSLYREGSLDVDFTNLAGKRAGSVAH